MKRTIERTGGGDLIHEKYSPGIGDGEEPGIRLDEARRPVVAKREENALAESDLSTFPTLACLTQMSMALLSMSVTRSLCSLPRRNPGPGGRRPSRVAVGSC